MTHLAGQIRLPKETRKRLQILCLLGGIGHLPYTYATEEAVLVSARLSRTFRRSLERCLAEVWQMASGESDGDTEPFKQVIDGMQVMALHAWLSALKIKRLPQAVDIGDRRKLVKERIDADCELNKLYRFVARLDYVQRDLYYTGLARFCLSAQSLLRSYQNSVDDLISAPASNLIDQLRSYLTDSLYYDVRSASVEALFAKKLAGILVSGRISLNDLLHWHDNDLDSAFETNAGRNWWSDVTQTQYAEISRSKVHFYRRGNAGRDTFALERDLVGLPKSSTTSLIRYPESLGFVVLCKNSFSPLDRSAATEVILSVGKQPTRITPITETISRLESTRRERVIRGRLRTRPTLVEDLLGYIFAAPVHAEYGGLSKIFASGVKALPKEKKRTLISILHNFYGFYTFSESEPIDAEYWEQFLPSTAVFKFMSERPKWVAEILRAAARDSAEALSDIVEAASWVAEHSRIHTSSIKWILPSVVVESDSSINQIDVCSVYLRGKVTVVRFIECTKSDSEEKAVGDLEKLEKIKKKCRDFEDLSVEQLVYGASRVREHFAPVQQLLGQFHIKSR